MRGRHTIPAVWLLSDARNDASLERALRRLPRGSGFIFRHYHLPAAERHARFAVLARIARGRGHCVILAGTPAEAGAWGADGSYGAIAHAHGGGALVRLASAHDLRELGAAQRAGADAVLLSPVHATRSHAGAKPLGPVRFALLARQSVVPVIALGGMTPRRAKRLPGHAWAAIDGLTPR